MAESADETGTITASPPIITTGINNEVNKKTYKFQKAFAMNVESKLLEYQLTKNREFNIALVRTWVHTLPWQFVYFYLTPKEFHDIQSCNH